MNVAELYVRWRIDRHAADFEMERVKAKIAVLDVFDASLAEMGYDISRLPKDSIVINLTGMLVPDKNGQTWITRHTETIYPEIKPMPGPAMVR